ncbi:MAG: response regulator [Luteitalea sp.]|nr:response regulator [Luteitalea sp.]
MGDHAAPRQFVQGQAENWGLVVSAAASGAEALAWIEQGRRFDLAIVDMQMPGTDDTTLAAEIRTALGGAAPPLIALTSLDRRGAETQVSPRP